MNINRLILYAGIFALYSVGFTGEFQFDDYKWIHLQTMDGLLPFVPGRPMQTCLLRSIYAIFGLNPIPYKIISALLHIGVVDAMLRICKAHKRGEWAVWLFAVHPVLASTVGYVIQSSVILGAFMMCWAFIMYERRQWVVCGTLTVLAMMCKQNAYVFPVVLVLYEWLVNRKKSLAIPLFMGVSLALWYVLMHDLNTNFANRLFSPLTRLYTEAALLPEYARMVILPHVDRYTLDHAVLPYTSPFPFVCLVIIATLFILLNTNRHKTFFCVGLSCLLVPEFTIMNLELMFEHRLYVPLAYIALFMPRCGKEYTLIYFPFMAWCIFCNISYQEILASQERLWHHTLRQYPYSLRANFNMAKVLFQRDPIESLPYFRKTKNCIDLLNGECHKEIQMVWPYYRESILQELTK